MRTITNGQARRIAAEWQAPRNAYSALQHVGLIEETLLDEITADMRTLMFNEPAYRELAALRAWAKQHGPGKVAGWGAWDDTPVR